VKYDANSELAKDMARFYADPLGFVMYAYPWGSDKSLQVVKLLPPYSYKYNSEFGPDLWACQFLEELGEKVKARGFDGIHAVDPIREAIVSGHGIGKSAMVAWLVDWLMSTRPHANGTVTANTSTQLTTKTWPQIIKWTKKCITSSWFDIMTGKGSMMMRHKAFPASWFCSAQTCDEENSESFAGQHAVNSTSFYLFDEASKIADIIDEVSEGGLTDGEPMKFAFGNGTQNTGWFHRTFTSDAGRKRWGTRHIDSREVQITNKKLIDEMIEDYGIDSDFVKVRVRGMFPSMSSKQFISTVDVDAAQKRHLRLEQYNFAPKILTLDNSWEGDDEGVIGLRQGLKFQVLRVFAKNDNDIQIATLLATLEDEHGADAVFIDGGYGTGVYSAGITMGREWTLIWFSAKSPDKGCLNLRAFMWREVRDWLKEGGAIDPKDMVLYQDLIGPETVARMDGVIQLEAKKDMKKRDLASPNRADALALSFAMPVQAKVRGIEREIAEARVRAKAGSLNANIHGHDPYAHMK
jgi:hypothetical protein